MVPEPAAPPLLRVTGLSKRYGDVIANEAVELSLQTHTVHCVLGENGAGKSTLMRCIYGLEQPDTGLFYWQGEATTLPNPRAARDLGIAMVFQHFSLVEELTIEENLRLYAGPDFDWDAVTGPLQGLMHIELNPQAPVQDLTAGEKQQVEILRALLSNPKLLILDEPTSVLTEPEAERLLILLRDLAERGYGVLLITHKLDEVLQAADEVTVLRRGRVVANAPTANMSAELLAELIIGAQPPTPLAHANHAPGAVALSFSDVRTRRDSEHRVPLAGISFTLGQGEILGIAGIAGQGQAALNEVLLDPDVITGGHIDAPPRSAMQITPEERHENGCVPDLSLSDNLLMTTQRDHGAWIKRARLNRACSAIIEQFDVRAAAPAAPARTLSGGNLQKFLIGRALHAKPQVLVCNNPTWGIDLKATRFVHETLLRVADAGTAVLLITQDVEELMLLADRIAVLCEGHLSPVLPRETMSAQQLGLWLSDPSFERLA